MVTAQREVEIEDELARASDAPEPGMRAGDSFHDAHASAPLTVGVGAVDSAGYKYVWDTQTGERSAVNANMMRGVLKMERKDGSRIYTITKPPFEPVRGTFKCPLHVQHPQHAINTQMGFQTCPKANLRTQFDVRMHMQRKHKQELNAIEEMEAREREAEERQLRRAMIAQAAHITGQATAPAPRPAAPARRAAPGQVQVATCAACGTPLFAKSLKGKAAAQRNHDKACPAKG